MHFRDPVYFILRVSIYLPKVDKEPRGPEGIVKDLTCLSSCRRKALYRVVRS